jgi:density-regulated protein DRP1
VRSGWRTHTQTCTPSYTPRVRNPTLPYTSYTHPTATTPAQRGTREPTNPPLEALAQNLSALSVDAQKRAEKDAVKKANKAASAAQREAETRASSKITIKRIERTKRKYVTAVSGLEAFGLDIKKVSKDFGKKFATGASVTKLPGGGEEITVQGDLSEDIEEFIVERYKEVPEGNIELVEDKKKTKGEKAAANVPAQ